MPDLKNVLFPVDFSLHCRGVAPFVRELTRHFSSQLTLIHGIAIPPEYYVTYGVNVSAALRAELRNSSTASLQNFADQEFGSACRKSGRGRRRRGNHRLRAEQKST